MMKKALCTALAATMLFSTGCSNRSKNEQMGLTFYCADSYTQGTTADIIKRYNKYCKREGLNENVIELVQFDSEKILYDRLSTETMAGGGPDLICTELELPYEKMIENKAFCDLNEMFENDSEINLADYNQTILDAGVFDGKRYLLPAFFGFDYMVADKETLDKFDISYQQFESVTYENFGKKFKGYFNSPDEYGLFNSDMWRWGREDILRNFIGDYVDASNKTCDFSSDEFKTALDTMTKAYKLSDVSETEDFDPVTNSSAPIVFPGFSAEFFQSVKNFEKHFRTIKERTGKVPVFFCGLSRDANDVHASVELAFAVNRNCRNKDAAFAFLKYILSENQQIYYCGDREGSLMGGYGNISMPVNNKAFSHNLQLALTKYNDDWEEIGTYSDYSDLGKQYISLLQNINRVTLYSEDSISPYYFYNVTGDIVYNYINGKIAKDKLIQQLISATETYLNE